MIGTTMRTTESAAETAVTDAINALRRSFLYGLDERICRIETAWVAVATGCEDASEALAGIEFEVHRISGIAGSLGLAELGAAAHTLEELIVAARTENVSSDLVSRLDARVNAFLDLVESELETL